MRISQTGPENNSALQNQNTENMSDEEEDDETIEEFQFEQTETENTFTLPNLQHKNKIIKFDTNKIVLKSFIV